MARFLANFAEEKLMRTAWIALCTQGEERKRALKSSIEALEKIEEELKGKLKFFEGENIGYLDLALGWISHYIPIWEELGPLKL
ncbi:hypothetical protein ACSBR1_013317 [Camellia fascicularis]